MTLVNCIGKRLKPMADVKLSVMSILNAPLSLKCVVSISNAPRRYSLLMVDNNAICRSLLKKRRFGVQNGVVETKKLIIVTKDVEPPRLLRTF